MFLINSDESVRVTHETILRGEGYEIVSAADGHRALTQIRESPPQLVLVGARVGQMSSEQLMRVLRHDAALSEVKVLEVAEVRAEELVREVVALIGRA